MSGETGRGEMVTALPTAIVNGVAACFRHDCPNCGDPSHKALYLGVPLRLCPNDTCQHMWGPGAFLVDLVPIETDEGDLMFWIYRSSYLAALAAWLRADFRSDDDGHVKGSRL